MARSPLRTALILATLLATATGAAALDLTGTWEGTLSCDVLVNNHPRVRETSRDNVLRVQMISSHEFLATLNGGLTLYGGALDDGRTLTRGEVVAQRCFPTAGFNVVLTADASVNDERGTGSLSGQLTYVVIDPSPAYIFTCRVSFRRTDPAPPVPAPAC